MLLIVYTTKTGSTRAIIAEEQEHNRLCVYRAELLHLLELLKTGQVQDLKILECRNNVSCDEPQEQEEQSI